MRVAIAHDWMSNVGGGGRVLTQLKELYPEAPIYTTIVDLDRLPEHMRRWDMRPSFLQRIPTAKRRYQSFLPLMPLAFEQFDLREYDLIISSSTACAKGVIPSPDAVHICYCNTPCRYIWDLYHDYMKGVRLQALAAPIAHWLRVWDRVSADRVDHFVANSREVASRIRRHYRRESEVIYPPVEVERFRPTGSPPEDFYLVASRLVNYKRVDLAIEACKRLDRELVVVGDGPARRALQASAGPEVRFLGHISDGEVADLMARCRALLFPGHEDFGIAPVEVQAAGRPVIAYARGGALETVRDGETGLFFDEQTVDALASAMRRFEGRSFSPEACRANAERFDAADFRRRFVACVERQTGRAAMDGEGPLSLEMPLSRSIGN